MNPIRRLYQLVIVLVVMFSLFVTAPPARAAGPGVITVNSTESTATADSNCDIREALNLIHGLPGTDLCVRVGSPSIDTIRFSIGSGPQTIAVFTPLLFSAPVFIDGSSQPGYVAGSPGAPMIVITGALTGLIDFESGSSGSLVKALEFVETAVGGTALVVNTDNITVLGSYLNTDGSASLGATDCIGIRIGGSNSFIGGMVPAQRNLFGGRDGIDIDPGSNNIIQGNFFGVAPDGNTALTGLPHAGAAISMGYSLPSGNLNLVRGNVITGFYEGISLFTHSNQNTIAGNYIGIGADGTTALGNGNGIALYGSDNNTLGGTTAADRNVISGNGNNIYLINYFAEYPDGNVIDGNYIGTTADGMRGAGSSAYGIYLGAGDLNLIGGLTASAGNVIAANNVGIHVQVATHTTIWNNKIGTNSTGTEMLYQNHGIESNGSDLDIGNSTVAGNNLIVGNEVGVDLIGSTGTTIYGNRLDGSNSPLGDGIDLRVGAKATIAGNWIGFSSRYGVWMDSLSGVWSGSTDNCFTFNAFAVRNDNAGPSAGFTYNWWRDPSGPTHSSNPIGVGDSIDNNVSYSPFLPSAPSACPTISGNAGVAGSLGYMVGTPYSIPAKGSGDYYLPVSPGWSGSVTPFKIGYGFIPWSKSYSSVTTNQTGQNYTAIALSMAGTYDEVDAGWTYTGAWATVAIGGLYHNSLRIGASSGATASFPFYGKGFSLNYLRYPGWGNIGVYLDGSLTPLTTINTNGAAAVLTYSSPGLVPGPHLVMLKHEGPAGTLIGFDSLVVSTPSIAGSGSYDFADPLWSYTGAWVQVAALGLFNNTLNIGTAAGTTATMLFHGTAFSLTYLQYAGWGSIAVYLDGSPTPLKTINTSGPTVLPTYTSPTLMPGDHMLKLVHTGPAGTFIAMDYVTIVP